MALTAIVVYLSALQVSIQQELSLRAQRPHSCGLFFPIAANLEADSASGQRGARPLVAVKPESRGVHQVRIAGRARPHEGLAGRVGSHATSARRGTGFAGISKWDAGGRDALHGAEGEGCRPRSAATPGPRWWRRVRADEFEVRPPGSAGRSKVLRTAGFGWMALEWAGASRRFPRALTRSRAHPWCVGIRHPRPFCELDLGHQGIFGVGRRVERPSRR